MGSEGVRVCRARKPRNHQNRKPHTRKPQNIQHHKNLTKNITLSETLARNLQEHNIAFHKHNGPPYATCCFNLIKLLLAVIEIPTLASTDLSLSSNKQAAWCKGCFWEKKFQRQKQLRKQFHILGQVHKLCSVCTKLAYLLQSESKVKEKSC